MKKLILFLGVVHAISLVHADHFTTGNYYCETGEKKWFKDSTNGNEYYMKLFFCKSTTDNLYKFISYNFYLNSEQSSLQDTKDISLPNDVRNITSMSMDGCVLRSDLPSFEFTIKLNNSLYRKLRICHNKGKISIDNNVNSLWFSNPMDTYSVDTLLSDAVYDTSK